MRATKILLFGFPIFVVALAACSGVADETARPSTTVAEPGPATTQVETSAADTGIQIGDSTLTWKIQEVGEGIKPAFAIDNKGVAHVPFLTEADHGGLFYALYHDGSFEVETVSEGYFYGPIDLALSPSGEPLIAYHDHQALRVDMALGDEVIAQHTESGWELTTVSDNGHDRWDNSIAVDQDGNWHTAAIDPSQFGGEDGVEYATLVNGAVAVVPVGSGPIKGEFGTSIQLDLSESPSVADYNDRDRQLELASLEVGSWSVEVVDNQGDAGRYASLIYELDGFPHIAYYVDESRESGMVRHAWKDASGWQIENVGILQYLQMGQLGARKITSLALDNEGSLHLAYTDRDRLIYAQRTVDGWTGQEVVEPGSRVLSQLVELAIDPAGSPHLIWYEWVSVSRSLEGIVRYAVGNE